MIKVGINGFGRIGRAFFRINAICKEYEIVVINEVDPDINNMAYLLKYDTTYGKLSDVKIKCTDDELIFGDEKIKVYHECDINKVNWSAHDVDVVIDSSGIANNVILANDLIKNNIVRKVIVTHSPKFGLDMTLMIGVNDQDYIKDFHHIISSSICDANAVTPFFNLINKNFGIEVGEVTTLHPWLSYQNVLDGNLKSVSSPGHLWNDYALGRNSISSLIPKDTSLVSAMQAIIPGVSDILSAMSFRTPTSIVSAADGTFYLKSNTSIEEVIECIRGYESDYPGVLKLENKSLVSIDYLRNENGAVVDQRWLKLVNNKLLKFVLWYDNEWGYAKRSYDLVKFIV